MPDTHTHTFFADESGNAGPNYLDNEQPFHVAAGFLIASQDIPAAEAAIRAELPPEKGECKGSRLVKTTVGQLRAIRVLKGVMAAGALPFLYVMDRRFSIAGKLVDVFLDPENQDAVDWLSTSDIAQRAEITELLQETLPASLLDLFASEYRSPTREGFQKVILAVIDRLRSEGTSQLVEAFNGALRNLDEIVRLETYGPTRGEHGSWVSLNLPALMHMIRFVDTAMDGRGTYQFVHDRIAQFEQLFKLNANRYRAPGKSDVDFRLKDGTQFRMQFRNLDSFITADSEATPMIQSADILASSVARVLREVVSGDDPLSSELRQIMEMTIPLLFPPDDSPIQTAAMYASSSTLSDLFLSLAAPEIFSSPAFSKGGV